MSFPLIRAAYLTVTQLCALEHLWFHDQNGLLIYIINSATVFQLKQDGVRMGVKSAVQQLQDPITNSLHKQLVNKVRKKSWMLLFTITLIELTIQETNNEFEGNCFLYFRVGLNTSPLEKVIYPLH